MTDLAELLAALAVPLFTIAALVNGAAAWRGRRDAGLLALHLSIALVSLQIAVGYTAVSFGWSGNGDVPVNVLILRPANLLVGVIFIGLAMWLVVVRQALGDAGRITEALSRAEDCQEELARLKARTLDLEQTAEIYAATIRLLREQLPQSED
jgi:heme A synthase